MADAVPLTEFIVAVLLVASLAALGVGLLFVRASRIERGWVVGAFTLFGSILAALLLVAFWSDPVGRSGRHLAPIVGLALAGLAVGWFVDWIIGPRNRPSEGPDVTTGADLAD
jgi:MFS family permease